MVTRDCLMLIGELRLMPFWCVFMEEGEFIIYTHLMEKF